MIELKRLNGDEFILNCEKIETIEATPDTVISLDNGKKYIVSETIEEVVEKVLKYKGKIACGFTKCDNEEHKN